MRLHPNSGNVDLRAPFSRRRVRLVEPEEEGEDEEGDWYAPYMCVGIRESVLYIYPISVTL